MKNSRTGLTTGTVWGEEAILGNQMLDGRGMIISIFEEMHNLFAPQDSKFRQIMTIGCPARPSVVPFSDVYRRPKHMIAVRYGRTQANSEPSLIFLLPVLLVVEGGNHSLG